MSMLLRLTQNASRTAGRPGPGAQRLTLAALEALTACRRYAGRRERILRPAS